MTSAADRQRRNDPSAVRRRVVVKFQEHLRLPYADGLEERIAELRLGPIDSLARSFGPLTFTPLFSGVEPGQLLDLQARAADLGARMGEVSRDNALADLSSYFAVECPSEVDPQEVADSLSRWDAVDTAYVEGGPTPPPMVNASDDPRSPNQGYLDPSPTGVDAEFAWTITGGDGAGIEFVDLEQGWTLDHEDLVAKGITVLSGLNHAYPGHGTSVLGEVVAVDNALGCVGIAPAAGARVVSQYRSATVYSTADAIISAVGALGFGDVLLLEAQTTVPGSTYLPVEVHQAEFDAIRLATALGIVVVEAAGNGGNDLDAYTDGAGRRVLDRSDTDFRDSGAIMVGAASSTTPHVRLGFSNHGSRIDCYAWGENIDTTGDGWQGSSLTAYTTNFGGTSGASPIVTGAALAVQGMSQVQRGARFSPRQLRDVLSSPATGTTSQAPATDRIGVMPDLRAIAESVLNVTPDLYVRDFVGDTGTPHSGPASRSPDVIHRTAAVADPQASYGAGSGTENDDSLSEPIEQGQDNHVYVRLSNRGGTSAGPVGAVVYWSPAATLVTPDLWTLIGTTTLPSVANGDVLTVFPGLTWPAAAIPAPGHYCLVCTLDTASDPAPSPGSLVDWGTFVRFIRDNNNVTWRNFDVVDNVAPPEAEPPGWVPLPFLAVGAPREAVPMALEVEPRLPEGAHVCLEAPVYLLEALRAWSPAVEVDADGRTGRLPLKPAGGQVVGEAPFPTALRAACRLLVQVPDGARREAYEVAVRQVFEGLEVGRVTWRLAPPRA